MYYQYKVCTSQKLSKKEIETMQTEQYHIKPIELNGTYSLPDLMEIIREDAASYFKRKDCMNNVSDVKRFIKSAIGCEDSEKFGVLFLDNKHRVIQFEILFHGTIDAASIHPREVIKQALKYNAAAVILCHNHPSGVTDPSTADIFITNKLKESLELIDIRVLDHIIVGENSTSFAERNLL